MDSKKTYHKANGWRVEGHGLAVRIAPEVQGLMLAMAYMKVKGAGFHLRVHKLDGQVASQAREQDMTRLNVEVTEGLVRKAWVG